MKKEIIINSSEKMINLAIKLGGYLYPNALIALVGDLGAGKTTFTKGIALALGIKEVVNSPTFTIMKIYYGSLTLYHLDVYRLENASLDFELEEYFEADGIVVIEWAKKIKEILPQEYLLIDIKILNESTRLVRFTAYGDIYQELIKKVLQ